jgi:hypothetical protein
MSKYKSLFKILSFRGHPVCSGFVSVSLVNAEQFASVSELSLFSSSWTVIGYVDIHNVAILAQCVCLSCSAPTQAHTQELAVYMNTKAMPLIT